VTFDLISEIEKYRGEFPQQQPQCNSDLYSAIAEFEAALPGWWFSICVCSRSRDASCGPDMAGPDYLLLKQPQFDEGFHCDHQGSLADALRDVMQQALEAKSTTHAKERG
jgi:hypothetical protein